MSEQKTIEYTNEQKAIFHAMALGNCNLTIEAVAGSGKTETSLQGVYKSPAFKTRKPVLIGSFMKRNQLDAQRRIQTTAAHVEAATWNSIGLRFVRANLPRIKVNFGCEWNRLKIISPELFEKAAYLAFQVIRAVELSKGMKIGVPTMEEMVKFFDLVGVAPNDKDQANWPTDKLAEIARGMIQYSLDCPVECSGADMNWLPITKGWIKPSYSLIVADEYQDTNVLQDELLAQLIFPGGSIVCVGDTFQSLYSWRGSIDNAMEHAATRYGAKKLSLTNSFRCPHSVASLAQAYVPHFRSHAGNIAGEVKPMIAEEMVVAAKVGDVILSRTNAPLMHYALKLIRANKPAKIEGKEVGAELRNIIETVADGTNELAVFEDKLAIWETVSIGKISPNSFTATERIARIQDIGATIRALSETVPSVDGMKGKLFNLFQNSDDAGNRPCVLCSTVHKAKGLEWPAVFQLVETFGKARATASERQIQEEKNISYVAVTRTKNQLFQVREK